MLTGKAEIDFKKWFSNYSERYHHLEGWGEYDTYLDQVELPELLMSSLIVEWLDEVGIFISIPYHNHLKSFSVEITGEVRTDIEVSKTRQEAVKLGIEKANEIYNAK